MMVRVISPSDLHEQSRRYKLSASLGLIAVGVGLVLSLHLNHMLRRSRTKEDQLRSELQRAERLAGIGQMLAGVAHEVRNPLAGIRSTIQLWQRYPERQRDPQSMQAVIHGVDQINSLVTNLLLFARTGFDARAKIDLNQVIREVTELFRIQTESQNISFLFDLCEPLPKIEGSLHGLRQVVMNLVLNAIQALPQGGKIFCKTWIRTGSILCTISDNGPGIPVEHQSKLFEPFFTTKKDGTGLGLALCREMVAQHGGVIRYVPGEVGASFELEFDGSSSLPKQLKQLPFLDVPDQDHKPNQE